VFCISASSVQSQRDFSSVGHTITHQVPTACRQSWIHQTYSLGVARWPAVTETCLSSQMFNIDWHLQLHCIIDYLMRDCEKDSFVQLCGIGFQCCANCCWCAINLGARYRAITRLHCVQFCSQFFGLGRGLGWVVGPNVSFAMGRHAYRQADHYAIVFKYFNCSICYSTGC